MKDYVLALSYGKDSVACLGAIKELGLPLTRVIHSEIWATETIPADFPEMIDFKKKVDSYIFEKFGIIVEHYCATSVDGVKKEKVTYEDVFYHKLTRGKHIGNIKGFPLSIGQWCQKLKLNVFDILSKNDIVYLGIACDEPSRIRDVPNYQYPLVMTKWDEKKCREWCNNLDLLAPNYSTASRAGCWFCHYQPIEQLRLLRKNHPELWHILLKWDKDSPVPFKADGHTVHDFDKRFRLEDEMCIDPNALFRWEMLDKPLQMRLF